MQSRFKDGTVMICGGCSKDAELRCVGEKQSRVCEVGIAVGKRADPDGGDRPVTIWCNLKAWHNLASILSAAKKGDPVFAIGRLETREYNGKQYTDLVAEYVSVCSISVVAENPATPPPGGNQFEDFSGDDGELPF